MKTIAFILFSILCIGNLLAQEQSIKTKSITLDDFISFAVSNYNTDEQELRHVTFLIQTNGKSLDVENEIILRQGFKIISERLHEDSKISIVTYSKLNGIALQPTSPKELKLILHTISDLKGSIADFYKDGIAVGYDHAEQHYLESHENTVVMIRTQDKAQNEKVLSEKEEKSIKQKNKKNALLAAAIGLLPELISVIKD